MKRLLIPILIFAAGCGGGSGPTAPVVVRPAAVLFDDFNYSSTADPAFLENWEMINWTPGDGSRGSADESMIAVSGGYLRMSASTDGIQRNSKGSMLWSRRGPFAEGEYSARVFYDTSASGNTDGTDQAFALMHNLGPDNNGDAVYHEVDFEYLNYDTWGSSTSSKLFLTIWDSVTPKITHNETIENTLAGWNILTFKYSSTVLRYEVFNETSGRTYSFDFPEAFMPDNPLTIHLSHCFTAQFNASLGTPRNYVMLVDWIRYSEIPR